MIQISFLKLVEKYLAPLTGIVLLVYLFLLLFLVPDIDFLWDNVTHQVSWVKAERPHPQPDLLVGDKIIEIGGVALTRYIALTGPGIWTLLTPQNKLPLKVERGGQTLEVDWPIFPTAADEIRDRLLQAIPPLVCLVSALIVQFLMRPKNQTWRQLVVVLSLTSMWITTGAFPSRYNLPLAKIIYSMTIWVWMPALLHLMWVYPYPLGAVPKRLVISLYLAGVVMGLASISGLIPRNLYMPFFAGTILLSVAFYGLHFLRKKPETLPTS